jgi:hypothetical protein
MTESDRRQQVLQAEEAILKLADQLALARHSRAAADEVAARLQTAQEGLDGVRASLQETLRAFQETTQRSGSALAEAIDRLDKAQSQVGQACNDLQTMIPQVREIAPALQRSFATALGEVSQGIGSLRRLVWGALVLSLLACGAALMSLLVLSVRLR